MDDKLLAAIAAEMNGVPETADRTKRYLTLVADTNAVIRDAASSVLTFDSSPQSFAAFKAASRGQDNQS